MPTHVRELVAARNKLKDHFSDYDLRFTFDGNLVGDLGEAVAADLFGLTLTGRSNEGIDGYAHDGRSVQVKASGTRRGPAFRPVETKADHLIVLHLDYDACEGEVIYNGPEEPVVTQLLPGGWRDQRTANLRGLIKLNDSVADHERLPIVKSN
ncbi:DUF6998 domain-containing protein [Qipengyuania vesicularis]|uniref:DUF6998 domain-containing protein n=1 Tax=Qipengyuania vesicularis TaxID=2867232 RepID=UPI001C86ABFC|nr:hypothetical protein [Qipengyuania vesicularis]MBX7526526.1 hypothetical protein [Qipengyuania vesicularis]